jgi:hypothetical protein
VWFRDVHDDAWIEPPAATFVRSAALRTPMAGGIVATMHEAEVERLKAAHEATVYLSFAALLAERAASAGAAPAGRNP